MHASVCARAAVGEKRTNPTTQVSRKARETPWPDLVWKLVMI